VRTIEKALLTEEEFVACVRDALSGSSSASRRLRVGIGDDAAVWKPRGSQLELITTDALVDGVHFRMRDTRPGQLGHKALAKNLSDIAAMAGRPTLAVIALGVTEEIGEPWVREFYSGLAGLAARHHCAIAGGDIVRTPALTIGVTVVGEVRRTHLRLRSGARSGDIAAVTGPLGVGAAGLRVIDADALGKMSDANARAVSDAYLAPTPRVPEGAFLGSRRACHALIDISDGLSTDLHRMAVASKVDAIVTRSNLRADAALAEATGVLNVEPMDLMLNGGDDYELLAAIAQRAFRHVARSFASRFGRPLVPIGRFAAGDGRVWIEDGIKREPLPPRGWNHLKRG
jgi:thiamine-monophosphate kinase